MKSAIVLMLLVLAVGCGQDQVKNGDTGSVGRNAIGSFALAPTESAPTAAIQPVATIDAPSTDMDPLPVIALLRCSDYSCVRNSDCPRANSACTAGCNTIANTCR